ncbi:MAG: response regulator [Chloroflexi bacterium]|uniref:response regulator n=1 Tax=Candidatus Flexifilum breve TaxID=3140694 RepID=UPI003134ECA6|nr:response regulator [Chloroflexota bacterium]
MGARRNPEAFLEQLEFNPDIILADYTLPRFTAPDALSLLQKTGRDIPFIVVTGSISEEAAVFCMKQGAADYLLKDRLSRLGEAVRHALHTQNLRLAQRAAERQLIVLGHAVDTSINAVVMTDIGGVITFINRAVLDLWSLDPDLSVIGTRLRDLLRAPAETERLLAHLTLQRSIKGEPIPPRARDGKWCCSMPQIR